MKINESQRIGAVNNYKKSTDWKAADQTGKKGTSKDVVEISQEALELLEANRTDDKTLRMEQLKQAVQSGTYQVPSDKIAEKLWPYIK